MLEEERKKGRIRGKEDKRRKYRRKKWTTRQVRRGEEREDIKRGIERGE